LLSQLPDTTQRQRTELELQLALGGALIAATGHATDETGHAYVRAHRLCELLNDTPHLLKALWGEFVHYHVRAEVNRSHRAAEQAQLRSTEALAEARELSHPISLAFALSVACRLHFVLAEPRIVLRRAEELIALTTEHGFAFFLAMGTTYRGWTLVEAGDAQ